VTSEVLAQDTEDAWTTLTGIITGVSPAEAIRMDAVEERYRYGSEDRHQGHIWLSAWLLPRPDGTLPDHGMPRLTRGYEWVNAKDYENHPKRGDTAKELLRKVRQADAWAAINSAKP